MSDDKLPLSFSRETLEEVKSLLRGADPDAPLVDRLRNPRTPYSPALLREEAADRIEELEAKLTKAGEILNSWLAVQDHCSIEEGVCCCGDNMEGHADPMNCGHLPVDHGAYIADNLSRDTRAVLTEINGGDDD